MFGWFSKEAPADPLAEADLSKAVAENGKVLAGMRDIVNALKQNADSENNSMNSDAEWLQRLREEGQVK